MSLFNSRRICIAPMLKYTDRHFRYLARLFSRRVFLYTEMVTTGALLHGAATHLLKHHHCENPLALQLGGSDPLALAECAKIAQSAGFDEVNLNIGCPSERVQSGAFGACLMAEPELVADCVTAMREAVSIPITVKTRLGIDHQDSYEFLQHFIDLVVGAGCQTIILHARKAWLQGLSPRQNRNVPPLDYACVYQIKRDFPQMEIIINGGITDLQQAQAHLQQVDGVMIGRAFYDNPRLLQAVDAMFYSEEQACQTQYIALKKYTSYMGSQLSEHTSLSTLTRHLLTLFQGQPNAKHWRRFLSERQYAGVDDILEFAKQIEGSVSGLTV